MSGAPVKMRGTIGHCQMVVASGRSGMAPSVTNSPGHAALSELKDIPRVSPLLAGKRRMVYFMFTGPLTTELFLMCRLA